MTQQQQNPFPAAPADSMLAHQIALQAAYVARAEKRRGSVVRTEHG